MKIVCEACGQRYAISDQKVVGPGRVFKVTCRQCSNGIIVWGISEEAASVSDEWHYVVGRQRHGPVDRKTLVDMVYDGALDERTYLWASGMEEWIRFKDIPGMNHLLEAAPRADDTFDPSDTTLIPEDELQAAQLVLRSGQDEEETPEIPAEVEEVTSGSGETEEPGGDNDAPPEATALISVAELERAHAQMIGGAESREAADKSVGDSAAKTETQPGELSSEIEEAFSLDEATSAAEHPEEESAQGPPADEDEVTTDPGLSTSTTSTEMEVVPESGSAVGVDTAEVISSAPIVEPEASREEEPAEEEEGEDAGLFGDGEDESSGSAVHQRQDTSVLFSLDDLSREEAASNLEDDLDPFLTEGSGLIDLKSLSSTGGTGQVSRTVGAASGPGVLGRPGRGTRPVDVPLIQSRQTLIPLLVLGALVLLTMGGVIGWLVARQMVPATGSTAPIVVAEPESTREAPTADTPRTAPEPTPGKIAGEAIAGAVTEPQETPTPAPSAAAVAFEDKENTAPTPPETPPSTPTRTNPLPAKAPPPPVKTAEAPKEVKAPTKRKVVTPPKNKVAPPSPAPSKKKKAPVEVVVAPAPPPKKSKGASNTSDVNSLLNQLNKKGGDGGADKASSGAAPDPSLPAKLGASAVRGTLKKRHGLFRACYKKMVNPSPAGVLVKTTFVIKGSGSVSKAQILSGGGTNAAVQSCVVKVLKATKFPRFREAQMTVNYPISLR